MRARVLAQKSEEATASSASLLATPLRLHVEHNESNKDFVSHPSVHFHRAVGYWPTRCLSSLVHPEQQLKHRMLLQKFAHYRSHVSPLLHFGFCMTYNSTNETTDYGPCPYIGRYETTAVDNLFYILLPSNASSLNERSCVDNSIENVNCGGSVKMVIWQCIVLLHSGMQ